MAVLEEPAVTGSRLKLLLAASVTSRLHLAIVLVGRCRWTAGMCWICGGRRWTWSAMSCPMGRRRCG